MFWLIGCGLLLMSFCCFCFYLYIYLLTHLFILGSLLLFYYYWFFSIIIFNIFLDIYVLLICLFLFCFYCLGVRDLIILTFDLH